MEEKFFTSDFINSMCTDSKRCYYDGLSKLAEKYQDKVQSDLDKYIYNALTGTSKYDTSNFNIETESSKIFNKNVPSYGICNTPYGEWLRAFNKLIYRYLNDGDDISDGPYSALLFFLSSNENTGFWFEDFEYVCTKEERINTQIFNNIISETHRFYYKINNPPQSVNCYGSYFIDKLHCDILTCIIDTFSDDIKNINNYNKVKNCADYYKNVLEFCNSKLYSFMKDRNLTHWGCDELEPCDNMTFEYNNKHYYLNINNSTYNKKNLVTFDSYTHNNKLKFKIHFDLDIDDEKSINNFDTFLSVYNKINKEASSFDLSLSTYIQNDLNLKDCYNDKKYLEIPVNLTINNESDIIHYDSIQKLVDDIEKFKDYEVISSNILNEYQLKERILNIGLIKINQEEH